MEVIHFRGNFGDDLNELVWPRVLSREVMAAEGVALLGIGSILSERFVAGPLARGERVYVIGSGAEYDRLPAGLGQLEVLAVRGPLTARLIGAPDKAVIDSAALLATIPAYARREGGGHVCFIPHYLTARDSRWSSAAAEAGLTFVDPEWDAGRILDLIRDARLVIAEAMHGAIVADTLRIPWIPVQISPHLAHFKWRDWTLSLDLPLEVHRLPPGSHWERMRQAKLIRAAGPSAAEPCARQATDPDWLIADFHARFAPRTPPPPRRRVVRALLGHKPLRRLAARSIAAAFRPFDAPLVHEAAEALVRAQRLPSFLSDQAVFDDRVDRLRGAVAAFERQVLA